MNWTTLVASEPGNRHANEDALSIRRVKAHRRYSYSLVICDGVGSRTGSGDVAANLCHTLNEIISNRIRSAKGSGGRSKSLTGFGALLTSLRLDNDSGILSKTCPGATTCSVIIASDQRWESLSIGDSRGYVLSKECRLNQITTDQVNERGELIGIVTGNGKLLGTPVSNSGFFDKRRAGVCLTTDGVHEACSQVELRRFIIFCIACVRENHVFTHELKSFLGNNISDNFSMALAFNQRMAKYVRSCGATLMLGDN
ncbi:MAG: protein phosphatase 2C domain-containing protein [Planctomycetales bacterium]|nr:protein phosphatase 2C domain-containing protein [Planctomycetales bacterium]